ncbi:MAG: hypothetical protein ABEI78_02060, partial [Candidatus Nanohaloarchaea archaeon]
MTKIELPLERLTEALDGGIEDGSSVLFLADLAVDKAEFAKALCNFRLDEEDNLIYFINNKMPEYIDQRIDKEGREDKVSIVDGFSSTLDKDSGHEYQLESSLKDDTEDFLEESKELAKKAIEENEGFGSTFVLDSLDAFVGQWDAVEDMVNEIKPVAERTNTVTYYFLPNLGFEEEGEQDTSIDELKEIFDYVIHLKGLERSGIVLKFIDVRKPEGIDTKVPYDVTAQGLVMYVPKILVTGPYDSGKSTTVQSMSEKAVSVDRLGTTVALDHGAVERKGIKAELFGTPGQKRFDWALDFLGKSTFGCF